VLCFLSLLAFVSLMRKRCVRARDISQDSRPAPAQGIDAPNEALEEKLTWVREAAGERFESLELSQKAYVLALNASRSERDAEGDGPPIPRVAEKTLHASHRQLRIEGKWKLHL